MKHGSLFSGIGGFDLAAEWMGWENLFHCEWMEFPRKVLDYYWPNADSHTDICKTDFTKYEGTVDIISGGFPCQPFSLAGKRKGTSDERYLWGEMLRAIREVKPKWVIAENVFGITNIDGGLVFEQVCLDLENEGYEVQPFIIPAAAKNAPHRRDRCWFLAYSVSQRNTPCRKSTSIKRNGCENNGKQKKWGEQTEWFNRLHRLSRNATDTDNTGNTTHRSGINTDGQTESSEWEQPFNEFSRPRNQGNATNTNGNGFNQCNSNNEVNTSKGGFNAFSNTNESNGDGDVADTKCVRLEYGTESGEISNQKANASEKRNQFTLSTKTNGNGYQSFWEQFPTQSPICGRNDGLPTELDGITFPKWRNESIKGYGNAIVPQIAYQLFQIIDELQKLDR